MVRWNILILVLIVTVPMAPLPAQDEPVPPAEGPAAAVYASLDVEESLLAEDVARYVQLSARRDRVAARLADLHSALDGVINRTDALSSERMETLTAQIDRVRAEQVEVLVGERALVDRIRERNRKIALLGERLELLKGEDVQVAGVLTGVWDLVLLPADQNGSCRLQQAGTLINGTYRLAGGWTGSLQGTLVNRKVYLVRIDSKLGRSMELEGILSTDGDQIRGTWLSYELAGGERATGQWSARKRTERGGS